MINLTNDKNIIKGKTYYVVRHANGDRKGYAICETHQRANGVVRKYHNKYWRDKDYNPLFVEKTKYM